MQNIRHTPSNTGYVIEEPFDWHSTFVTTSLIVTVSLLVIAHLVMALGVSGDVQRMQEQKRRVHYFGPGGWWIVVLFLGIIGLVAHWLMHHSSFRAATEDPNAPKAQ